MADLSQLTREMRRDAAALPTGELRTEIEIGIHVLDVLLDYFESLRPCAGNLPEAVRAAGDVIETALRAALYVSELARRPAPAARVQVSPN